MSVHSSYDWINEEDIRYDLAAETVRFLFHERTLKEIKFDIFYPHLAKYNWKNYPSSQRINLEGYYNSLTTAVEAAHKERSGLDLKLERVPLDDCIEFCDLVLRVYCRIKESGKIPD